MRIFSVMKTFRPLNAPSDIGFSIGKRNDGRTRWRRSAIEAVIGHCKTDGHLSRNFLKQQGFPLFARSTNRRCNCDSEQDAEEPFAIEMVFNDRGQENQAEKRHKK
jgi:hypothetical protein